MSSVNGGGRRREDHEGLCQLCGRAERLTFHHLIPRRVHKRARYIREHGKDEMRARGLYLCKLCHRGIHEIIPDERVLARSYNTRELLLAHEGVARHVAWVAKQK